MKILIYGCGAVGSVFAGFLAKAGQQIVILGRPWHIDKILQNGLEITGIWGNHLVKNLTAYTDFEKLRQEHGQSFDLILLTVKSYDTASALDDLKTIVSDSSFVLSSQNGLENIEIISKIIGSEKTIGGRVIFGAEIYEPGKVKVTVSADDVVIGRISDKFPAHKLEEICEIFNRSGVKTRISENIIQVIWSKALYNCALNPLATILEVPYGELLEHLETRTIMKKVIFEIYEVARAKGIDFENPTPSSYLEFLFKKLIPLTAGHYPSMLQDIKRGRRTEIEALNGRIVDYALELKIAVPINQMLTDLILTKEKISVRKI